MVHNQSRSGNSSGNAGINVSNNKVTLIMDNLEIYQDNRDFDVFIDGEKIDITEEDRQRLQKFSGISFKNGVLKVYGKVIYPKKKVTEEGNKTEEKMRKKKKNGCCSIL